MRAWRWFIPRHRATPAQTDCGGPDRQKLRERWQVRLIVGGVRNGAAEEDLGWDLNPGATDILGSNHTVKGVERGLP